MRIKSPVIKRSVVATLVMLGVIVIDQIIKVQVKTHFVLHESVQVTDWFQLLFTENRGMAFGMDFIGTFFLSLFRVVAIVFFFLLLLKKIKGREAYGLIVCLSLVIAGAVGNLIDNMFYGLIFTSSEPFGYPAQLVPFGEGYGDFLSGQVVDMFYFPLFKWPNWVPLIGGNVFFGAIFNFADAAISCGAVSLALFYYKSFLHSKENTSVQDSCD